MSPCTLHISSTDLIPYVYIVTILMNGAYRDGRNDVKLTQKSAKNNDQGTFYTCSCCYTQ